jgi:integrase
VARTVRGGNLETRAARLRLKPRGRPYYVTTAKPGLHLGYRRIADQNGRWIVRRYMGGGYTTDAFAQADDYSPGDEREVLTYHRAAQRVSGESPPVRKGSGYTVQDAVDAYLVQLRKHSKSGNDTAGKLRVYVTPRLGSLPLGELRADTLDAWVTWALAYRRRVAAKPRKPKADAAEKVPLPAAELERRRKTTVNRVITALKATLQFAYERKQVHSREAWSHLQKFGGVESARLQRLTTAEAKRLLNACPPDFRRLVEVALLTGCRYGELCALNAGDYDSESKTLLIADSKSGKPRRIPLTDEGHQLLEELTAGRESGVPILAKADGTRWSTSEQSRRIAAACAAANISPPVTFHAIRHSFASMLVERGTPLMFVATVLGHRDTRMVEKHYAHLAPSIVAKTIRKNLPTFGVQLSGKVTKLQR